MLSYQKCIKPSISLTDFGLIPCSDSSLWPAAIPRFATPHFYPQTAPERCLCIIFSGEKQKNPQKILSVQKNALPLHS